MNRFLPAPVVALLSAALVAIPSFAHATASDVTPSSFRVTVELSLSKPPREVYAAIGKVDRWWSSDHTWSGSAANLSLPESAGSCFCEKWIDKDSKLAQSVVHGTVIAARPPSLLRLSAALGPMQTLALNGVFEFEITAKDKGSALKVTYLVRGDAAAGLDKLAPVVDEVMTLQMSRLQSFIETGHADQPATAPKATPAPSPAATATSAPPVTR